MPQPNQANYRVRDAHERRAGQRPLSEPKPDRLVGYDQLAFGGRGPGSDAVEVDTSWHSTAGSVSPVPREGIGIRGQGSGRRGQGIGAVNRDE